MRLSAIQNFAIALKQLRAAHGMTQEELAERSGVSVRSISDLERGISRFPHKDTVRLLVDAMHLTPEEEQQMLALTRVPRTTLSSLTAGTEELPFVGREREMQIIRGLLANPAVRLLTLTGVAGIGKTRLAIESASLAGDTFIDGINVIDLSSIQAAQDVVPAIARELGVRERASRSPMEAVIQLVADRRMLLVLDNCEQVLDARTDLAQLLESCAHLTMLVTSREQLHCSAEHVLVVPPLATPNIQALAHDESLTGYPAVMLFIECAQALHSDISLTPVLTRTIARICARLEGVPLAIELAAARISAMHPRAILAQLSGSSKHMLLRWLHHDPSRASRQQTLHNALAWSYRLLDAREQIVFRRLSIFVSGWTVEAAETVCDPHHALNADMHAILASLVSKSLISQDASSDESLRYSMHFVMRAYGAELLEERRERNTIQHNVVAYYAGLVEGLEQGLTGATQAESLRRLVGEYENIRAALQWAREQHAVALGLKMAGALWWFWENRGYLTEGREWIEGMLAIWQQQPASADDETIGRAYYGATILAITQGDNASGQMFAEACLDYLHAPDKRARVFITLGNLAKYRGSPDASIRFYTEGLSMLRAANDTKGMLVALNNLSTMYIERGELQAAMPLLDESLALKRAIGDRRGIAVSLMNQGEVLKAQGHYRQAQEITQEGFAIFEDLGDMQGLALASNNLGEIAEASGDDVQAATAFAMGLTYYRRMEDRPGMAMALFNLGRVYARQRDAQAVAYLQEGADLYADLSNAVGMIECALALASFDLHTNAPQAAMRELQRIATLMQNEQSSALPDALRERYAELLALAARSN